jgi:hypothetical protein
MKAIELALSPNDYWRKISQNAQLRRIKSAKLRYRLVATVGVKGLLH